MIDRLKRTREYINCYKKKSFDSRQVGVRCSPVIKQASKLKINKSATKLSPMNSVLEGEKEKLDNSLFEEMALQLKNVANLDSKLKTMKETWNKAILMARHNKTLNEIKDQLFSFIQSPEIEASNKLTRQKQKIRKLKQELYREKEYSEGLQKKLKVLSKENIELFNKQKESQGLLDEWIKLSAHISGMKSNLTVFQDLLKECRLKDDHIASLEQNINSLKNNAEKLRETIKKQELSLKKQALNRSKSSVLNESSSNITGKKEMLELVPDNKSISSSLSSSESRDIHPSTLTYNSLPDILPELQTGSGPNITINKSN